MTSIGSENLTNGPGKPERFGGKYRGARRDTVLTEVVSTENETVGRDSSMATEPPSPLTLPSLDPNPLTEPSFPASGWSTGDGGSLVDHPLLRGLMMELPPKGSVPPPDWLDRWFEATRAILELLYVQSAGRTR
ncbi:hypothetical protein [Micromonospora endophytica]|uniref:Uncharacterized protein n=1 Tax=Micromonospora endophytica TaxID=515350 RepID=A0A2W2CG46_9ACTN|nr:hypothetical protein [Micromonospora endophytica]PZF98385.1 hypothetical protein C1I93_09060 [Micromonospora endophytica]RIW47688.1 hypothetical protein D3H59_09250 [Micromonospora endophytica]BCJ59366.1 hypothetical protein Jiend_27880 [Micromonospora endophytica]